MEVLAAELVFVKAVIQEHIAVLKQAESFQHLDMSQATQSSLKGISCLLSQEAPSIGRRPRKQPHLRIGSSNFGSVAAASSNSPEGSVQPAAGQLAGPQCLMTSRTQVTQPSQIPQTVASNKTAEASIIYQESTQERTQENHCKVPGWKRRAAANAAAAAAIKDMKPGLGKVEQLQQLQGRAASSVVLAVSTGSVMFETIATEAQDNGPS